MRTVKEIQDLKEYYEKDVYGVVRKEQRTDNTFYQDTFPVPQLEDVVYISRTGGGAEIIDNPVKQIAATKMIAFRKTHKDTKGAEEAAIKISGMINQNWIDKINKQGLVEEHLKNQFLRGEAWVEVIHNERWVTGSKIKQGLPVHFLIPDPMLIYASPNEDENGTPEHVIVFYERMPWEVKMKYPAWTNPKKRDSKDKVMWLEYIDKDVRYYEADGEAVLKGGIQENIYHFVNYIHKIGGFGKRYSPNGKMEDVIVGRLKKDRNLLERECAITSDVDYAIHAFSNRSIDVQPEDDQHQIPADFQEKYEMGTGIVHELPSGIKVERSQELLPEQQILQYLYAIRSDVGRQTPLALTGQPLGETGRLQDIGYTTAMKKFEGNKANTEYAFASAFGMALKIIDKVPGLMPDEIKGDDIHKFYEVTVELKAEDPIAADRLATAGSRYLAQNEIDPETNLVEYKGYTQERAREILVNTLKWKVLLNSPDIAMLIGLRAAEKSGMLEEFLLKKQEREGLEKQQQGLMEAPTQTAQGRTMGETKTPLGKEMMDSFMGGQGARRSPERYTRNQ